MWGPRAKQGAQEGCWDVAGDTECPGGYRGNMASQGQGLWGRMMSPGGGQGYLERTRLGRGGRRVSCRGTGGYRSILEVWGEWRCWSGTERPGDTGGDGGGRGLPRAVASPCPLPVTDPAVPGWGRAGRRPTPPQTPPPAQRRGSGRSWCSVPPGQDMAGLGGAWGPRCGRPQCPPRKVMPGSPELPCPRRRMKLPPSCCRFQTLGAALGVCVTIGFTVQLLGGPFQRR